MAKIMEKLVLNRILHIIPREPNLYGFVQGKSTTDALVQFISDITNRRNKSKPKPVTITFLDLDKAFERASPLPILEALINLGCTGKSISWIRAYLSNRSMKVFNKGIYSESQDVSHNIPQGSILSPTLFNSILINILNSLNSFPAKIIVYADDMVLITEGRNSNANMQNAIDTLNTEINKAGLIISPAKTKVMRIGSHKIKDNQIIKLNNMPIESVKSHMYLGVKIDHNLTFIQHAQYIKEKLQPRFNMFKIIAGTIRGLCTRSLIILYKALILSVLLYAAPVMIIASKTALDTLESLHKKALRMALGLPQSCKPHLLYLEAETVPIKSWIKVNAIKYICRSASSPHPSKAVQEVQNNISKNMTVFKSNSWTFKMVKMQQSCHIPLICPSVPISSDPWLDPPWTIIINNSTDKHTDPEGAAQEARQRIQSLSTPRTKTIYTDASRNMNADTAWAFYDDTNQTHSSGSLPRNTPITQAELFAIYQALLHFENHRDFLHSDLIVNTDSMAALFILDNPHSSTYPELHSKIVNLGHKLTLYNCTITLNWIPSHVNIYGNEVVDELAKQAIMSPQYDTLEHSTSMFANNIKELWRQELDSVSQEILNTSTGIWYNNTTNKEARFHLNRLLDTQLRKLRFRAFMYNSKGKARCNQCHMFYSPEHFLIECPQYAQQRYNLVDKLQPDHHRLSLREQAELLLRRISIDTKVFVKLIAKDQYKYQE